MTSDIAASDAAENAIRSRIDIPLVYPLRGNRPWDGNCSEKYNRSKVPASDLGHIGPRRIALLPADTKLLELRAPIGRIPRQPLAKSAGAGRPDDPSRGKALGHQRTCHGFDHRLLQSRLHIGRQS